MEFSPEQMTALAQAIAKALPASAPVVPIKVSRERHNWMAIAALVVTILGLMGAGFGVWVASSNQQTALAVRISSVVDTVTKNGTRIDRLEQMPQPQSISPRELQDLKDNFAEFRVQYKDDVRDLKLQVQSLQDRKGR